MNVLAIVQARMGSSRLPGKVLLKIIDKTVIEHVVARVLQSRLIDEVVVATSIERNNLPLVKICSDNNIRVFCGSENDVLDRFYQLAKLLQPNHIVRITADCPLIDPDIIDKVIQKHLDDGNDYTSNTNPPTFPDGLDVEVFTFSALENAWEEANLQSEREHVTPYIYKNYFFKIGSFSSVVNYSNLRWTLDEERDFKLISLIYKELYTNEKLFTYNETLNFIKSNPKLQEINSEINRNEGFVKSVKNDKIARDDN